MSKVRVAVIGCGNISRSHISAYLNNPDAEITYFCDIIPERAHAAVETYGCGKAIVDYKEILHAEDIDIVSVCTPNREHSIISIDFLKAGKDVLCEKPAARILDEALKMQAAQKETGKILNIGVVNRFNTAVNYVKKYIDDGELGEVFHVYASFRAHRSIPGLGGAFTTKAISGGGALIDWGVHYLDLIMYCCGDPEPLTVSGEAFCKLGKDMKNYVYKNMWASRTDLNGTYDVDDSVTGIVRTTGPVITFNGAWAQNIGVNETYIDFMGDKGGIRLNYGDYFTFYTTKDGMLIETKPDFNMDKMFQAEIDSFIECYKTRQKSPAHIDNAILTSKIMQAVYDSSEEHREVSMDRYNK